MSFSIEDIETLRKKIADYLHAKKDTVSVVQSFRREASEFISTSKAREELIAKEMLAAKRDIQLRMQEVRDEEERIVELTREREEQIRIIAEEKSICFPWVADAIARLHQATFQAHEDRLDMGRAKKAAATVRACKSLVRRYKEESELARFRVRYYEALFPWLQEYVDKDIDEELIAIKQSRENASSINAAAEDDPVKGWLSDGEFRALSSLERNQRALDNWRRSRNKSNWEVGRDYERFVGQNFEREGYRVLYTGALEGREDMGRDVIASRQDEVIIVQCKYWSSEKTIHEKHIFQLYGTCVEYLITKTNQAPKSRPVKFDTEVGNKLRIVPRLVTSTCVSDKAKIMAKLLGVEIVEQFKLDPIYPIIKCNISKVTGEKIYHLPFDQQYDKTVIDFENGEFYARSVDEAESSGFRRAWRFRGH